MHVYHDILAKHISLCLPVGIDNLSLLLLLANAERPVWARVGQVDYLKASRRLVPLWPSHHDIMDALIFSLSYDWILITPLKERDVCV
jgi:hypothetical protein